MSAVKLFDYAGQQVRTVLIDGEPWFVAADVCSVLGIANSRDALSRLDDDEKGVGTTDTPGGRQSVAVVSEAGIYGLTWTSRKDEAGAFRRWIKHDVLPSIRRTGSYSVTEKSPMEIIADQHKAVAYLLEANEQQAVTITALTPKAEAWDDLASAEGDFEVGDAAKILARAGVDTGRQRLFSQLADMTWIYRGSQGKWTAYQSAVSAGYLAERPQSHHHPRTGELVLDPPQVRVTAKGLERLRRRLGKLDLTAPILTAVNA